MSVLQINKPAPYQRSFALLELGFRPFFLGAALLAIASIFAWILVYFSYVPLSATSIGSFQWHAHEMIYGFSVAVVAGFLLTAVMNWTGVQTVRGAALLGLFSLWCTARLCFLFGARFLELAAVTDLFFLGGLLLAVASPIIKAKQWRQIGILAKLLLLLVGNFAFYLGVLGHLSNGIYLGLYGGLYLIISLILTIGGRVIPSFIENGVDDEVKIANPQWLSAVSLVLFEFFFINQLFIQSTTALGLLSIALFCSTSWRLVLWHTPGIWKRPLLWSLYLAFVSIDVGFLLYALSAFAGVSAFIAVHAFAFGGIGLAILGMMARVTLGHTGRSIRKPPASVAYALSVLTLGVIVRVGLPLISVSNYATWIFLSQLCWIVAFGIFLVSYTNMLLYSRVDGKRG